MAAGLEEGTAYFVRVLASNRVGYSEPAEAMPLGTNYEIQAIVVTETDPAAMQELLATSADGTSNGLSKANFTLTHHDPNTGREFTTRPVPLDASAAQVPWYPFFAFGWTL